jgi:UDP-N-acetylglucosamine acyltransferase
MIQPLANIHPEAIIGKDVIIEPFVTIEKDVVIGDGCWIGSNAVIKQFTRLGNQCKVFCGAVVGEVPQDLKFNGEVTYLEVGNNTTIREFVTLNRGTASRGKTVIGSKCLLMAYMHVGHDCVIGNNVIIGNATQIAGEVEIGDHATISAACLIHQFSKIGAHVMIQGGSKIGKDVPPYITAGREPLAFAGLNSIGLRRRGFSNETINTIQDVYRAVYQKGLNTTNALKYIEAELPQSPERDEILRFIKNSDRGIIPGPDRD